MKKTTIILLLAVCQFAFSQNTQIEAKLKGIQAKSIQGEKLVDYDMIKHIKNKVVILEFWETWCGPCIQGMPHLKQLKDKFPNDLQIICISSDDVKKTSSFVSEHSYPFDYVFDAKKQLSVVFPHGPIPHTVVIDKNGRIQAETYPGYLTEEIMRRMISTDSIDVPTKNYNSNNLDNAKANQSLLTFELSSADIGDRDESSYSNRINKKRIITGYTANAYKDTIETIQQFTFKNKNILELYCFAFNELSKFRFVIPKEIEYIKFTSPNYKYRLNYSESNLLGDYHSLLIRQLNAAFGLETEKVQIDTTVLVLKKIEPNGRSITIESNPNKPKSQETNLLIQSFEAKGIIFNSQEIALLIETKTHLPVEFSEKDTNKYNLDISIKADFTASLEEWLRLFEKEGIFLVKEKKKAEFIRIKKVCP